LEKNYSLKREEMPGRTEELQKAMEMFGADETVVTSSLRGLFNSQVTYGKRD